MTIIKLLFILLIWAVVGVVSWLVHKHKDKDGYFGYVFGTVVFGILSTFATALLIG
jgi:hypothetical protein